MKENMTLRWADQADERLARLIRILREMESMVVAFSGGTDSSFLAAVAHHVLADRALMVSGVSPSVPARDREDALRQVEAYGWRHRFVSTEEFANERFVANPPDRCYHCKMALFGQLQRIAKAEGLRWVADGSNRDDTGDYRPGARANCEWQVRSPLQEAGFRKTDVREMARRIGLPTADKPASACLASRLPYGERLTPETLASVDRAEQKLAALGFSPVRVRKHGDVARIELAPSALGRAMTDPLRSQISDALKACGYSYVTLDIEGYRMGSMNEVLSPVTVGDTLAAKTVVGEQENP